MSDLELMRGVRALFSGGATQLDDDTLEKIVAVVDEVIFSRHAESRLAEQQKWVTALLNRVVDLASWEGSLLDRPIPLTCWGDTKRHVVVRVVRTPSRASRVNLTMGCGYRQKGVSPRGMGRGGSWSPTCLLCRKSKRSPVGLKRE